MIATHTREILLGARLENPLAGAMLSNSMVEMDDEFVNSCPRCGRSFICYNDHNCWCHNQQVHPKTQEALRQQYRGCLCQNCLSFYAG